MGKLILEEGRIMKNYYKLRSVNFVAAPGEVSSLLPTPRPTQERVRSWSFAASSCCAIKSIKVSKLLIFDNKTNSGICLCKL